MKTIDFTDGHGNTITAQVAQAMDAHGRPAPIANDTRATDCDHAGETWSQDFDLRCTRCGSRLFLPASRLAHRTARDIERMYLLWRAAGWPQWWNDAWDSDYPRVAHPLFAAFAGIPVAPDCEDAFEELAACYEQQP
jgi:hypothetical protein